MSHRSTVMLCAALSLFAVTSSFGQVAAPSIAGKWELDVTASKSTDPMPKSVTRVYEVFGNSEKLTGTIVTTDGKTIPIGFTATLDGKDSPSQNPGVDTVVLTPIDALTVDFVTKLGGQVVYTGRRVLSRDGKVMTLSTKGKNAAGQPSESTMVFNRQ